ncbi:MAG: hypothetical protein N2115_02525, partial [bacterium]|nr:hypothetical protein [bacterium]
MRRIFLIVVCLILLTGCGKKQPQVQKPQPPISETQSTISPKEVPLKKQLMPLYPVEPKKQFKAPDWVKEIISTYDKNYNLWREKSSTDTSTILIASLTSSGATSSSAVPTVSSSIPSSGSICLLYTS